MYKNLLRMPPTYFQLMHCLMYMYCSLPYVELHVLLKQNFRKILALSSIVEMDGDNFSERKWYVYDNTHDKQFSVEDFKYL